MQEIRIYNTLTKKKEIFKPLKKGHVHMYSCGPTVYWYQHIGNLRTYISNDLIKRVFIYNNYNVKHVINVTDVGHLTNDEDTGEDKIEKAARTEKKTAKEISEYYFKVFERDLKKLNVIEPNVWPHATKHIQDMIKLIKILEKKGYTYKTSDGIYFDTRKFENYGELTNFNIENLKTGLRVDVGEKRNPTDFALWILSPSASSGEQRQQEWKSPWGIGFPGWHIECSAMSSKYLGKQFDVHTGGPEHIAVHHTNEIAQSEAAFGKRPWVRYWIHFGWLLDKGKKISKSEGKIYTLSQLEEKGFSPMDFRFFCLLKSHSKPLNFSIDNLKSAQKAYQRLKNVLAELKKSKEKVKKKSLNVVKQQFLEIINDDFNSSKGLSFLWDVLRDNRLNEKEKYEIAIEFDKVFGLNLDKEDNAEIPARINRLAEEREIARQNKDWKKADEIRDKIKKMGFVLEDTEKGVKVKRDDTKI